MIGLAKAREKASQLLEASVEDIEYRDGTLTVAGTDKRIGLFDIAKKEQGARLSVDSEGQTDGPSWPNGTHICEVEIDPDTGVTRVVRYTTVDDVGVAINPMLVTGQVHGGVAQGIGQALYEGVTYNAEGQLLTASYQDYCIPRADEHVKSFGCELSRHFPANAFIRPGNQHCFHVSFFDRFGIAGLQKIF